MNPQDPAPLQPPTQPQSPAAPAVKNPLSVMQPGEQVVCEIKRHPVGMVGIYIGAGLLLIIVAVLALVVAPSLLTSMSHGQVMAIGTVIFLIAALFCLGFVFVSNKVYWGNSWVVTSDSITQISQLSLFDSQSSQLSLGNLEDVTAEQNGILPHMFNFGLLRVETAGERSKFMFHYCPDPNHYAQQILNAREQFEQRRSGDDLQRPYRSEGTYVSGVSGQPDSGVNVNTE